MHHSAEVVTVSHRGLKANCGDYLLDGKVGLLKQRQAGMYSLCDEPADRTAPSASGEATDVGACRHVHSPCERLNRDRLREVIQHPSHALADPVVFRVDDDRRFNELSLATGTVRSDHQPPGDGVGDARSVVLAYQMNAQIQSSRAARARQHVAIVDVENFRGNLDQWEALRQQVGVLPVCGGPASVQKAGRRQGERAGADRYEAGHPAGVRGEARQSAHLSSHHERHGHQAL